LQHEEQEILARLHRGERVNHFDTVRMARDGRRLDVSLDISPLRDASGHIIGASKIARDITERKQAEEQLRQLNQTLESRVQERTEQVRSLVTQLTMSEQEERRRISAILHDEVQQRLYSLNFQLTTQRRWLAGNQVAEAQQLLDEIEADLRQVVLITRNLSVDLSPPVLYNEGIFEAIRWLAAQMEQQQRLTVTVVAEEDLPPIDDDLRVLLFQFVRELLFNVVKHAAVSMAEVSLACADDQLRIEVSDQGQGFDTNIANDLTSQGLQRITQRLQLVDGTLRIASSSGQGTRVTLLVPLRGKHRE
jgi:signal transduction histidine kinase